MDIVRHNLRFLAALDNDSEPLNIYIKDNKITKNEHSWLRSTSVNPIELYHTVQWTFDNAVINFWENYNTSSWLSERYREKYSLMYDAFVSLQYIYNKCEDAIDPKLKVDFKNYDKELDQRLDLIYENCIEVCKPWEHFKQMVRLGLKMNDPDYECVDLENSDSEVEEEEEEEEVEGENTKTE